MKTKFKFMLAAFMAVCLLTSCSDEKVVNPPQNEVYLTLKLADGASSRALEVPVTPGQAPGNINTIVVDNGMVFVLNASGDILTREGLIASQATSTAGQTLSQRVPTGAHVYVIANIPSTISLSTLMGLSTLAEIQALEAKIEDVGTFAAGPGLPGTSLASKPRDYAYAPLANVGATGTPNGAGVSVPITSGDGTNGANVGEAFVTVNIKPVIARLELTFVQGNSEKRVNADDRPSAITEFTVTGVYVDDHYTHFRMDGSPGKTEWAPGVEIDATVHNVSGSKAVPGTDEKRSTTPMANGSTFHFQGNSTDFSTFHAEYKDVRAKDLTGGGAAVDSWLSDGTLKATAGENANGDAVVWAYNVPSGTSNKHFFPRLLVELDDIKVTPQSGGIYTGKYYLTVSDYGPDIVFFERGKLYRVEISFNEEHLNSEPNPLDSKLTVKVYVEPWILVKPPANLYQ